MYSILHAVILSFTFIFIIPVLTEAALAPEEIVVLVNSNSPDSIRIGTLYIELRKVPAGQLIMVNVTRKEDISRENYDELIVKPVRKAVNEFYNRGKKIRCIVTTFGIPLRIGAVRPLIVPKDEIDKYDRIIKQKNREIEILRKERGLSKSANEDLDKEIRRLRKEIEELYTKTGYLQGSDTVAAVDSDLALILIPDYPLSGWIQNQEFIYNRKTQAFYSGQVLMVSRLDAPTPELAEGLFILKTGRHILIKIYRRRHGE